MSTDIKTDMTIHELTQFWGGDELGMCVQITPLKFTPNQESYLTLTMEEAAALINSLTPFVRDEALRRQGLLKTQLDRLRIAEKTVFHEIADFPREFFWQSKLCVEMVSQFCPKALREPKGETE